MIQVKSIFKRPSPADGERIYVDPLWANGAFTEFVKISEWNKEVAPSYELWRFHYDPENWEDYVRRYREELSNSDKQKALNQLLEKALNGTITLVYGNGDETHNNAIILKEILEEMAREKKAA